MISYWYESIAPNHTIYYAVSHQTQDDREDSDDFVNNYHRVFDSSETTVKLISCNNKETFKEMKERFNRNEDKVWLDRSCYEYEIEELGVNFQL